MFEGDFADKCSSKFYEQPCQAVQTQGAGTPNSISNKFHSEKKGERGTKEKNRKQILKNYMVYNNQIINLEYNI